MLSAQDNSPGDQCYVMQITMYNALVVTSHVGNECRQSNHQGDECTEGAIKERTSFGKQFGP